MHDTAVLFVPWICAENKQLSLQTIDESLSTLCMGHLELQGYGAAGGDARKIPLSDPVPSKSTRTAFKRLSGGE
jgi:hypothetical protein